MTIALVPLCLVISITYRNAEGSLTDELQKGLRAIAERQSILINNTVQDSQEQAEILASSQAIITAMGELANATGNTSSAVASLETIAEVAIEGQRIDDVMLLDLQGRVVFTARTRHAGKAGHDRSSRRAVGPAFRPHENHP